MRAKNIPNIISILRILLVAPVAWLLVAGRFADALLLFAIAGISDGLDGYLAKRNGWHSRLGSILDPIADKLLLVTSFVVLGWLELTPLWLVAAVLGRDVIIIMGALAFHILIGQYAMAPSLISKANTAAQIFFVVVTIFAQSVPVIPEPALDGLTYIVLATTVLSGFDYVAVWGRRALQERAKKNGTA